jgi:hypothetical protein
MTADLSWLTASLVRIALWPMAKTESELFIASALGVKAAESLATEIAALFVVVTFGFATTTATGGLLGPGIGQPSSAAATICSVVATVVGQTGFGWATCFGVFTIVLVEVVLVALLLADADELAQSTT